MSGRVFPGLLRTVNRPSKVVVRIVLGWLVWSQFIGHSCHAQQYRLSAPELNVSSLATLTESKLDVMDAQGIVNVYLRNLDFDSQDGQWLGYQSRQSGKVLLWPIDNTGHLQIGTMQQGVMQFSPSRMQIQVVDDGKALRSPSSAFSRNDARLSGQSTWSSLPSSDLFSKVYHSPVHRLPQDSQPICLVSTDTEGRQWAFSQRGAKLGCAAEFQSRAIWWVAPVAPGVVRLQIIDHGKIWAVSAADRNQLRLSLVSNDSRQLWRVCPAFQQSNLYLLENVFFGATYLTHLGHGDIGLQPLLGIPPQLWAVLIPPTNALTSLQPFWRSVRREIRPNPPLPPADLELVNSHRNAVGVLIGDQRQHHEVQWLRIEPKGSASISVERDAGATLVETVEIQTPLGDWSRQEYVTEIPPSRWIDLSVYEEFLQSIAIDRTGKSPNRIEDINVVPRSVGFFFLAAGAELPEKGQVDVYTQAVAANNPGAVRRLTSEWLEKNRSDPVESILESELLREKEQTSEPKDGRRSF